MSNILAKLAVVIEGQTASFNKALAQSDNQLNKFANNAANIGKSLVAGFGLLEVSKGIIDVTGRFQRFEAVLSNTLGSDSEAQKALSEIQRFASQTPFAVDELTGAFVKLSNQGFTPTTTELRSLGDLASSTGKSFDQLAEAIIDAQTGEFERLKEFGIRAKKSGDQVTFTFKGIQTTVKNTSDSIRDYVLSLGEAEGVSGAMAKISETLEGKISNLGDAWDNLLLTIGQGNKGVLVGAVETLTTLVNRLAHVSEELELDKVTLGFKDFRDLSKETLDYIIDIAKTDTGKTVSSLLDPFKNQSNADFFKNLDGNRETFKKAFQAEGASVEEASTIWKRYIERRLEAAKADDASALKETTKAIFDAKTSAEAFLASLKDFPDTYKGIGGAIKAYKELLDNTTLSERKSVEYLKEKIHFLEDRLKPAVQDLMSTPLNLDIKFNLDSRNFLGIESTIEEHMKDVLDRIASNPAFDITLPAPEIPLDEFGNALVDMEKEVAEATDNMAKSFSKVKLEIGGLVSGAISSLAQSLGEAAVGTVDLGKALLQAIGKFAVQFGELLIASGVGTLALQSGNAYAMIAGGAVLVAAGAALSALSKQRQQIGAGSASGGAARSASSSSTSYSSSSGAQDINLTGTSVIKGSDLWIIWNNYNANNKFTKPAGPISG